MYTHVQLGLLISLLLSLLATPTAAQLNDYSVSQIPSSLIKSANSVARYDRMTYIVDPNRTKEVVEIAITFLNEKSGREEIQIPYNSNSKIKKLKARLYDAEGQLIRKIEKSEIHDFSAVSNVSIFEDSRYKQIEFNYSTYPYTIAYEYEIEHKEVLFYPSWFFLPGFKASTQQSHFQLKLAAGMDVRYKKHNCDYQPKEGTEGNYRTLTWSVDTIPAIVGEPYSPNIYAILPFISIMPRNIKVEGIPGDLSSWKDYGDFMYRLNEGRDILSSEMIAEVKAITAEAKTNGEKIDILYRYIQENMRYVSVQLGIGGWQTFDAQYVEKNRFGDCKALTNFMKALLKVVDIEAYVALVYGGSRAPKLEEDFPSNRAFNHVILNIPEEDCWLECTSNRTPVNHTGGFTGSRQALLLTEEGGKLVNTPAYTAKDNLQHSRAIIELSADGSAEVENSIDCFGMRYDVYNYGQEHYPKERLDYWFANVNEDLPTFDTHQLSIRTSKEKPESGMDYTINIRRYATRAGRRLFVPLNLLNAFDRVPPKIAKRRYPVESSLAFTDWDEYEIHLPEGYELESLPEDSLTLNTEFGRYELKVTQHGQSLKYHRKLSIFPVKLPAERYADFRAFYKQIAKLEKMKLVLVKQ